MLIVISPAKTLDYETPATTASNTLPDYLDDSAELITQLRTLSPPEVSNLMGISAKLGDLNFGRFLSWQPAFTPGNAKQSLLPLRETYIPDWMQGAFRRSNYSGHRITCGFCRVFMGYYGHWI